MNVEAFFEVAWKYHETVMKENPDRTKDLISYLIVEQLRRKPDLISLYGGRERLAKSIEQFIISDEPKVMEILRKQFCHIPLTDEEMQVKHKV